MATPYGSRLGQKSEACALGEKAVEGIVEYGETLQADSPDLVRAKQVGAEEHGAVGLACSAQVVTATQVARRDIRLVLRRPLSVRFDEGAGMHQSHLGMSTQIVDLHLQFAAVGPVVVAIEHRDHFAAVLQDLLVEQEGVFHQPNVVRALAETNTFVLLRQTTANLSRGVGRSIVADVDRERLVADLTQHTLDAGFDIRRVIICRDANSYHIRL